ncbi:MAG TPA: hypothetical protein VE783_13230 [Candidatus Limnocylindrales bacterium]|nr:hypothetical protein [Candidatus Limnocylindrales bacterium]
MCQPSANSVIYQLPHIEAAATPTSGSISSMKVFIDGKLSFQNSGDTVSLFPGGVPNGTHHLVITATDDFGRSYNASETFSVTGNLPSSCTQSTVGVRLCSPVASSLVSQNLEIAAGFKGEARITHLRAYVSGKTYLDYSPAAGESQVFITAGPVTAGSHTLKLVAWDALGHAYTASTSFTAYYDGGCSPKGDFCSPAIYTDSPQDGEDVSTSFRISAQVQNNPAPITAMKAYLSGAQVAVSSGPTLDQTINAPKGTHILTVQAWDSAGKLYRNTLNVNVR